MPDVLVTPKETQVSVKVRPDHRGFVVIDRTKPAGAPHGEISFACLHRIRGGMTKLTRGELGVHESKGTTSTVKVTKAGDIFHVHAKPFDHKAPEVSAFVSTAAVDAMIGLAQKFQRGLLALNQIFEIDPATATADAGT